jgi:hypothetical protein
LAWQGIRKRSWQTEQTSSSGGTGDEEAAELIPLFFLPSFLPSRTRDTRTNTSPLFFCFVFFPFHGQVVGKPF